jgi:hypothetical protein
MLSRTHLKNHDGIPTIEDLISIIEVAQLAFDFMAAQETIAG